MNYIKELWHDITSDYTTFADRVYCWFILVMIGVTAGVALLLLWTLLVYAPFVVIILILIVIVLFLPPVFIHWRHK